MKYIQIIKFLIANDLSELKNYLEIEFLGKKFKWSSLVRKLIRKPNKYIFWYRLAYVMYRYGNYKQRKIALKINDKLSIKYAIDIPVKASIGIGFVIWHHIGIVITERAKIGKNFCIAGNITIGLKSYEKEGNIIIGDNVMIGANSVIFGQNIIIGSNVKIGAMSFINKSIGDNCTVYTEKTNKIICENNIL